MLKKGNAFAILALSLLVALSSFTGCAKKKTETPPPPVTKQEERRPEPRVTEKAPVEKTEEKVTLRESDLNTIYFDYDKSVIKADQRSRLEKNAQLLKDNPSVKLLLEGHCDERGSNEYNIALGDRRAKSVQRFLSDYGISSSRVQTVSYGEERPASSGHNESAWSQNRRCEFTITSQ